MPFSTGEILALRNFAEEWMVDTAEIHEVTNEGVIQGDLSLSAAATTEVYDGRCRVRVANDRTQDTEGEQVFTTVEISFPHDTVVETDFLVNVTSVGDPYLNGWWAVTEIHAQGQHVVRKVTCRRLSENRLRT